jgi:RNA polymerase sigma-70 factor (ECF subfamily)
VDTSATASQPPPEPAHPAAPPTAAASDFGSFYQATSQPLQRFLSRLLGDQTEAQDIAQDAFVRTYATMQKKQVEKPRSFLFTTARNLAFDFRSRKAARMQPTDTKKLDAELSTTPDPAENLMSSQAQEAYAAALLGLPAGCQRVLTLRLRHNLSYPEIARELGISESTVGNQFARAARLLRERLANLDSQRPAGDSRRSQ